MANFEWSIRQRRLVSPRCTQHYQQHYKVILYLLFRLQLAEHGITTFYCSSTRVFMPISVIS